MADFDKYYKTEDLFGEPYPGLICICQQDTGKKVSILKETIDSSGIDFEILSDSSLIYDYEDKESGHKSESKYCMYIVKKK